VELLFVALAIVSAPAPGEDAGMPRAFLILAILPLFLGGCVVGTVAKTAVDVVTLPVKVASAGVDAVTTSQSERDEKLGREVRKQDEERGRLMREQQQRCLKGKALPNDDCSGYLPR
jgi:hypothetical protein